MGILTDEKIKRIMVDYSNLREERLFPDSPDARNTYTMENILSMGVNMEPAMLAAEAQDQHTREEVKKKLYHPPIFFKDIPNVSSENMAKMMLKVREYYDIVFEEAVK